MAKAKTSKPLAIPLGYRRKIICFRVFCFRFIFVILLFPHQLGTHFNYDVNSHYLKIQAVEFESTHNEGLSFAPLPCWRCFAKQNSIVSLSAKHMILPAYPYRDSNPENLVPETSMYSVPSYGRTPRGIRTLKTCVLSAVRIPFRHGCINKPFFDFIPQTRFELAPLRA